MKGVKFLPVKIGDIPCEWVLAPGADPDLRLLYLHGGGFVSGSGGFYLTLAAHLSAAAKCAVLLPDYRLAPEHRFPAGLEDCIRAHEWLIANGPAGPAPCHSHVHCRRFRRRQPDSGDPARTARPGTTAAGGRNRPLANHRFNALERILADRQRSDYQCAHHARVSRSLSREGRSSQPAGLARIWRLPRPSAAADSGRGARDAPRRQCPGGGEGACRRNPREARSLAGHVPCVPVPRAAAS